MGWAQITILVLLALSILMNIFTDEEDTYDPRVALPACAIVHTLLWIGGFYAPLIAPLPLGAWLLSVWPQLLFIWFALRASTLSFLRWGQVKRRPSAPWTVASGVFGLSVLFLGGFFGPTLLA